MATITVADDTSPTLNCFGDFTIQLAAGETTTLDLNEVVAMVSDNCNFTISSSPLDFSGDNPGTFQIIVEATDDGGNVSDCLVNVTVDQSSSVIDIANDQRISVYPNPT